MTLLVTFLFDTRAQDIRNRWNVYVGGSISHVCSDHFDWDSRGNTHFDWGGGAFIGGGYEINFNRWLSFTPSVEVSYVDNGCYYNKTGEPGFDIWSQDQPDIWSSSVNINIPLQLGVRIPLAEKVRLKVNAGVYMGESVAVWHYVPVNTFESYSDVKLGKKEATNDFGQDFQLGFIGGVAVETGKHFSYFIRTQYPFLKDRWSSSTLTLGVGVDYSF